MAIAMPRPICQRDPAGAASPRPLDSALSTRSMHLVQSVAAEFEITVFDVPVDKIVSGNDDVAPPKL